MIYRNSSWTGRSARTMQQAFGPHTRSEISERPTGYPPLWWVCVTVIAAAMVAVLILYP